MGRQMADIAAVSTEAYHGQVARPIWTIKGPARLGRLSFSASLLAPGAYGLHGLTDDIQSAHEPIAVGVFLLLGLSAADRAGL